MVKVATYFAMTLGAFIFWQSMDRVHVWIALHQDEKQERMEKEMEIKRVREELLAQQAKQKDSPQNYMHRSGNCIWILPTDHSYYCGLLLFYGYKSVRILLFYICRLLSDS
ncbi:hypothetical protein AAC387_Pa02g3673 [Persea americana]